MDMLLTCSSISPAGPCTPHCGGVDSAIVLIQIKIFALCVKINYPAELHNSIPTTNITTKSNNRPKEQALMEEGPGRRLRNISSVRRHIDYVPNVLNHLQVMISLSSISPNCSAHSLPIFRPVYGSTHGEIVWQCNPIFSTPTISCLPPPLQTIPWTV